MLTECWPACCLKKKDQREKLHQCWSNRERAMNSAAWAGRRYSCRTPSSQVNCDSGLPKQASISHSAPPQGVCICQPHLLLMLQPHRAEDCLKRALMIQREQADQVLHLKAPTLMDGAHSAAQQCEWRHPCPSLTYNNGCTNEAHFLSFCPTQKRKKKKSNWPLSLRHVFAHSFIFFPNYKNKIF